MSDIVKEYADKNPALPISLTTDPGFSGTITFTYTIQDPGGLTATGTVNVTFVNNTVPIAGFVRPVRASLSFDGSNDTATTAHYAAFDDIETAAGVTFESWMLVRGYPQNYAIPFDKYEAPNDWGWHMAIENSANGFGIFPNTNQNLYSLSKPALNSWAHLAMTLNQSTRETVFYINGVEVRRATSPSALRDTAGEAMVFGASPSGGDEFTNGLLGEIRLWKRILTGDEIRTRMNVQTTGTETDLAAAWSFDAGSGTTVPNQVSSGLPAVFATGTAAPTWSTFAPPVNQRVQDETAQTATPLLIALQGSDADGHALTATITALPARGQLFQFAAGAQGDAITAADTAVTDPQRRVVYVSNDGVQGSDRIVFTVTDTLATSLPAIVNLTVNPGGSARQQWIAGNDFALIERPNDADDTSNPNALVPEWSYGTRSGVSGSAFTPLTLAQHADSAAHADIDGYTGFDTYGGLLVNTGTSNVVFNFGSGPLGAITPKSVWLHPGATGTAPVVRWTTPVAGSYVVNAAWADIDPYGGDGVSANILVNGAAVFSQTLANGGSTSNTQTLALQAGDLVDFATGMNSSVGNDSTRFDVTINRQETMFSDVWDLARGSTVTSSSPMLAGSSAGNAFDGGVADAVFADGAAAGFTHFMEWQTPSTVLITAANLTADDEGPSSAARGFSQMRLFGRRTSGDAWTPLATYTAPANPYFGSVSTRLFVNNFAGTQFRAEFDAAQAGSGPRVAELDGIGEPVVLQTDPTGTQIGLQNASATASQGGFPVGGIIDGVIGANGWAGDVGGTLSMTAAVETGSDITATADTEFIFKLFFPYGSSHQLGCFRLSATTDARNQFADGLSSGGDVTANWTLLDVLSVSGTGGETFTILGDKSVLVGGPNPNTTTYTLRAKGISGNVTGFRIEALENNTLPTNGPGRAGNGNWVFSEMTVAVTAPFIPNYGPRGTPDTFAANQDFPMRTTSVLSNDTDPENNALTLVSFDASSAQGGSLAHLGAGVFDYTPSPGFNGTDTFTYRISDGFQTSSPVTVTMNVAAASIVRWANASGGQWTTASNWTPARVPTSSDTVIIDLVGTYTITLSTGTQSPVGIIVAGAGVTATLNHTGGTLSPARNSVVKAGSRYTLGGGTLTTTSDLLIEGDFQWSNGTKNGAGTLEIATAATASTSSGNQLNFHNGKILNRGSWTMGHTGQMDSIQGSVFENRGLFLLASNVYWDGNDSGALARIHNEAGATIRKTVSGDFYFNPAFENRGLLEVQSGRLLCENAISLAGEVNLSSGAELYLGAGGSLAAATTFTGSGVVNIPGGTFTAGIAATIPRLSLTGCTFTNTADVTVTEAFSWTAGFKNGSGTLELGLNSINSTSGGSGMYLHGGKLLNRGTLTMSQTGQFDCIQGAILENRGLLVLTSNFYWDANDSGALARLHNEAEGTIRTTGGGATTTAAVLENRGRIEINANYFATESGATMDGSISIAAGAGYYANSGTTTLASTLLVEGDGFLYANGGSLACNADMSIPNLGILSGSLSGTGTVTITGTLSWTGGNMTGSGRTIIPIGRTVNFTGTANRRIDNGRVLENRGEFIYNGDGLSFGDSASSRIVNTADGIFEFRNGATLIRSTNIGHTFENAGLLRKTGTGTTFVWGSFVQIVNTGTIRVEGGGIHLDGGATLGGIIDIASACTFSFSNQLVTLSPGVTITGAGLFSQESGTLTTSQPVIIPNFRMNGGILNGTGEVRLSNAFTWNAGTMDSTGRTIIASGMTVNLTGTGSRLLQNGRILENRGSIIYNGSGLGFNGTAGQLINAAGASFELQGSSGITRGSVVHNRFTNAGLLRKTGAGNSVLMNSSVWFYNDGLVQLEGGALQLDAGLTQTLALAEIRLMGGNLAGTTLTIEGGRVTGVGSISANVINSGATISPDPTGTRTITITGTYTQGAGGNLELDLDSDAATGAFDKIAIGGAATFNGGVLLRNNLALSNEVFPLVSYASRSGSFASITTSSAGTATATYLAARADFTVTVDAPAAPAPELAANYEDWTESVERTWLDGSAQSTGDDEARSSRASPTNTWDSSPMADPDKDGAVNLLEYAMQTNPLNGASIARPEVCQSSEHPGCIEVLYRMRAQGTDISYQIEHSADGASWQPLTASTPWCEGGEIEGVATGVNLRRVRINTSATTSVLFKVRVVRIASDP